MKDIRDKTVQAAKLLLGALPVCLVLATFGARGQTQIPPGTFQPPKLPPIAHEIASVNWPVPDYFMQALEVAKLRPTERAAAFKDASTSDGAPPYLVLPVQSQAFGYGPAFRALVGAYLDQQLEAAGLAASRQTDAVGAYGPFVRRLSDTAVDDFVAAHPRQTIIGLYLGHNGVDETFVTLVIRAGAKRQVAHQTVKLPADPLAAAGQLQRLLPTLIRQIGLPVSLPMASPAKTVPCDANAWLLTPPSSSSSAARACQAIIIGSLLPLYGNEQGPEAESASPARLAWLAQAFVLADSVQLAPATAKAVRALALKQLALPVGTDLPAFTSLAQVADPVVSRLAQLKGAYEATETGPSRSAREARQRLLEKLKQGLPVFVSAVLDAQADYTEAFSEVDTCPIEQALPGAMLRPVCRDPDAAPAPRRAAWPAETLLFQEWRLASYFKAAHEATFTQGSRARTDEALSSWPADVAAHPYLQRLRVEVQIRRGSRGSFDDQVKAAREDARRVTQTSVDLQRADRWLASYSLTGHMWTDNLNIMNDAEVRDISLAEQRLLSVLQFDRFTVDRYMAERRAGDPPLFLAPSQWLPMMVGPMSGLVVMAPPSPTPATEVAQQPGAPFRPPLFSMHIPQMELASEKQLTEAMSSNPRAFSARIDLARLRLRNGESMTDVMRLIDAAPDDKRPDHRVAMSHLWADPGHIFYFAGELEAAKRYYLKVAEIGTGSESDMMARTRLKLLDGRLREALESTAARVDRYDSDFARRDQASLLFMFGQRDQGWAAFLSAAPSSDLFQLWVGAYTGHRMEGADLTTADRWIESEQLGSTQISYKDARSLYLHLLATMDRMPTPEDIAQLKKPRASGWQDPRWAASALLIRSALGGNGFKEAQEAAKSALVGASGDPTSSFMLPLYAWTAWQATNGKDEILDEVRRATTRWDFDEMLSKSLVLALDGETNESLKFFNAARYELAGTSERVYPAQYSYALAGYLMFRKTGNEAYRQQTLQFVRSQQRVFPFYGWLYAMQALLDADVAQRKTAACRARYLDPHSYFLGLAGLEGVNTATCEKAISSLLR